MGGGGNQNWTGNWNPVIIKDPIPKIKPTKIKDYDIEGIPGLPGPKSSRKGKRPKKGRKTENTSEVDLIFGSEKPKRTKTTPRPLTKYQKYKLTQKSLPENIAKLQAERDRRAKLNSLTPEQKVEHFAHNKFIDKKASQFFKKHGRPPTSVDKEKWTGEFKKYQKQQATKDRQNAEHLFGKMTDKQWKEHQKKRSQFQQKEEKKRKRGY